jgi:DNA modification methylase
MMTEKKQATLKIERLELSELQAHPRNPRNHPEPGSKEWEALRRSLESDYFDPIVWNKTNGYLVSGHLRVKVLREAGYDSADAVVKEYDENTHMARMICANQQAGEDDMPALGRLLEELKATDTDSALVGFSEDQIDAILADLNPPEIVEDDVPEPPETAKTELGRMYQIGKHRLMCGDSTSEKDVARLMCGEKADMVFTDPPYGIDFTSDSGKTIKNDSLKGDDMLAFNAAWQKLAYSHTVDDCFLMSWQSPRLFHLLDYSGDWRVFRLFVMYKSNRISYPHGAWINKTEPCVVFAKGKPQPTKDKYMDDCYVYTHDKESHQDSNVGHPTPKPVKMIVDNIVACVKSGKIVLDLFGGSGSTLIACEQTNRACRMMELDPRYCDVIVRRWAALVGADADEIFKTGVADV